uniref:Uncharacterized protein n=1 Tax=Avena sativa TaxID=4498 RepID=A0ACD5UWF1_AVESA
MANSSPSVPPRRVIVSHRLPLQAAHDASSPFGFSFTVDADSVCHQLRSGLPASAPVLHVGTLPAAVAEASEELASYLVENFCCLPVFLPADLHHQFYHGFCKHYMWQLLHSLLPLTPSVHGGMQFDDALYHSFLSANMTFANRLKEVLSQDEEEDLVWIHDYHLLALPTFVRKRFPRAKVGFFLHSPFPSLEIFGTIPVRKELLGALLNADLVGFHIFDYARHFMSACSRLLGLAYTSKCGYMGTDYCGRRVNLKILPVGIDMAQLRSVVSAPETGVVVRQVAETYKGQRLMVGVDDADLFKGIELKFLGMEKLLLQHPELRGRAVLVQIVNPARSEGLDIQHVHKEARAISDRVNAKYATPGYTPIVMIDHPVSVHEKAAYYAAAECCVVSAVQDGLNRIPYIYTVCRQDSTAAQLGLLGDDDGAPNPKGSVIVLSEFAGCSRSLSGAIRLNPWSVESVKDAMNKALRMSEVEQQLWHEKHYKDDHYSSRRRRLWGIGFGMSFKVVALGPDFCRLSLDHIAPSFRKTENRLILLDYDGTVMPAEISCVVDDNKRAPSSEVISVLNRLCEDPKTKVFIVSGRGKDELSNWFAPCEKLGIAAEHGYFTRWSKDCPWETCGGLLAGGDFGWKKTVEPVMKLYTDMTDGSSIEYKESALVWHYHQADPDFGSFQAKALLHHLENVLAKEPVVVKRGQHIVEVKPHGISKGVVVESLLSSMVLSHKPPDFVLCIGDDRSDEDMFESIMCEKKSSVKLPASSEVFACTVGMKPSMAKYYLHDTADVIKMLQGLDDAPSISQHRPCPVQFRLCFEDAP